MKKADKKGQSDDNPQTYVLTTTSSDSVIQELPMYRKTQVGFDFI